MKNYESDNFNDYRYYNSLRITEGLKAYFKQIFMLGVPKKDGTNLITAEEVFLRMYGKFFLRVFYHSINVLEIAFSIISKVDKLVEPQTHRVFQTDSIVFEIEAFISAFGTLLDKNLKDRFKQYKNLDDYKFVSNHETYFKLFRNNNVGFVRNEITHVNNDRDIFSYQSWVEQKNNKNRLFVPSYFYYNSQHKPNMFDFFLEVNDIFLKFAFAQKEEIDSYLFSIYQLSKKSLNLKIDNIFINITDSSIELENQSSFNDYLRKFKENKV